MSHKGDVEQGTCNLFINLILNLRAECDRPRLVIREMLWC